ncbi:Serine/threonine-protein kinase hippo [Strongyloides ratti]|uniref:Serine/threonine-protein kinase cst-1 n=1 Tax=Strongyloides ratti TaxID=34506 RepID=A0A090L6Z7_STRRB|nr:Serine/threonine-protein kinase hippo [Strongyloides ratti]CEF63249.1 Serine/threonine-protein kinase hippo [Strongyloides ratti]
MDENIIKQDIKLDQDTLNKDPDEVFTIVSKLGEGSYGSVHKAVHKSTGHTFAIKTVKVGNDLQEIIKEISIMKQCDSEFVVKYFGSYFKNSDLWIVMEYCGAGSISDIMRIRRKTLNENEIAVVLKDALHGLKYLHDLKKIHRDIKAGNILLNENGRAKLADFGVSGQLTDTMAKRNTVIGTPYWMAPEVIRESGYDSQADCWSIGVTAIEMAEGKPPHAEMHPMRAIFLIPTKPAPTLKNPKIWSKEFWKFTTRCLVKNPEERANASDLLEDPFITSAKDNEILLEMIKDSQNIAKLLPNANKISNISKTSSSDPTIKNDSTNSSTMIYKKTLKPNDNLDEGNNEYYEGTLIQQQIENKNSSIPALPVQYNDTFKTAMKADNNFRLIGNEGFIGTPRPIQHMDTKNSDSNSYLYKTPSLINNFHMFNLDESGAVGGIGSISTTSSEINIFNNFENDALKGYGFLKKMTTEELLQKKGNLEFEMDNELRDLQKRYQIKRQPILDAIELKKNNVS